MKIYIVLMRRYGDIEGHTYIHGIYTDLKTALQQGKDESLYRGKKYDYEISECTVNSDSDATVVATACE